MDEHTNTVPTTTPKTEDDRPPLWKQILGAVLGGALALALYYSYEFVKPKVTAYLTLPSAEGGTMYPPGASNIADKTMDESHRKRILSRNLRAAGVVQDNTINDPALINSPDDHSLDVSWQGDEQSAPQIQTDEQSAPQTDEQTAPAQEQVSDQQVATGEIAMETDAWGNLWGDIKEEEAGSTESINAQDLPDSGFGLGFIAAGAAGGVMGFWRKKKKSSCK